MFSVIPRIIYLSNKTLSFSKKEDAIFNMMAKMMDISIKEYDENNTKYDDILLTHNNNVLECNTSTGYRVGGFIGSRNCLNKVDESKIGPDSDEPPYDDVDDYDGYEENISSGNKKYKLKIVVGYTDEWNKSNYKNSSLVFNFKDTNKSSYTNIKRIYIVVSQNDKNISSISYYSSNIGHIEIKSIVW